MERIYEINENLKAQEEEFFKKWLKVREAKGVPKAAGSASSLSGQPPALPVGTTPKTRKTKEVKLLESLANAEKTVKGLGSLQN